MTNLYDQYKNDRDINVSMEEFQILVLSYPIFKVANADGNFDQEETQLLSEILVNFLSEIYTDNLNENEQNKLAQLYIEDLLFLDLNREKYDQEFLKLLSTFSKEIKESISSLLTEIAEVSGGLDKLENEMIQYLHKNYLA